MVFKIFAASAWGGLILEYTWGRDWFNLIRVSLGILGVSDLQWVRCSGTKQFLQLMGLT